MTKITIDMSELGKKSHEKLKKKLGIKKYRALQKKRITDYWKKKKTNNNPK